MGGACSSQEGPPATAAARPAEGPSASAQAEPLSESESESNAYAPGTRVRDKAAPPIRDRSSGPRVQVMTKPEIALLQAQRNLIRQKQGAQDTTAAASGSGDRVAAGGSVYGGSVGSGGSGITTSKVFEARKCVCTHVSPRGMCAARKNAGSHFCERHMEQYTLCPQCRFHDKKAGNPSCFDCSSLAKLADPDAGDETLPPEVFGRIREEDGPDDGALAQLLFAWCAFVRKENLATHTGEVPTPEEAFRAAQATLRTVPAASNVRGWRRPWAQTLVEGVIDSYQQCSGLVLVCIQGGTSHTQKMAIIKHLLKQMGFTAMGRPFEYPWGSASNFSLMRPDGAVSFTISLNRFVNVEAATKRQLAESLSVPEDSCMVPNLMRACVLSAPGHTEEGAAINDTLNTRVAGVQEWLSQNAAKRGWPPSSVLSTAGSGSRKQALANYYQGLEC